MVPTMVKEAQTGLLHLITNLVGVKVMAEWLQKWQNSAMFVAMLFLCQISDFAVNVESKDWVFETLSKLFTREFFCERNKNLLPNLL